MKFYMEEVKGRVDYQGYIFPRRRGETVSKLYTLVYGFINVWVIFKVINLSLGIGFR
jgi:hypothetical protein